MASLLEDLSAVGGSGETKGSGGKWGGGQIGKTGGGRWMGRTESSRKGGLT